MPTYLPPNPWITDVPPQAPAPAPEPELPPMPWCERCQCYHHIGAHDDPKPEIGTVGDYINAHGLHVVIAIPGFHDLPIDAVAVEHDELTQLTYFTQQGSAIGTASWSTGGS